MGKCAFKNEVWGIADNVGLSLDFGQVLGTNVVAIVDAKLYYEEWVEATISLDNIEDRKEWVTALRGEANNPENFPQSFIDKLKDFANEIEKTILRS